MYGGRLATLPAAGVSPYIDYMLETLFGVLWQDPTLSIRERRLLIIGVLAAQGEDATLGIQLRCALKRGRLTSAQLQPLAMFSPSTWATHAARNYCGCAMRLPLRQRQRR